MAMSTGIYISGTEKSAAFRPSAMAAIARDTMSLKRPALRGSASFSGRKMILLGGWSGVGFFPG